jgi:hypothetical protein
VAWTRGAAPILLLLLAAVAGCTSSGASYVKQQFKDAEQRVVQSADGGYSEFWEIKVPPAAAVLTVRASFVADQGLNFTLRDPDGHSATHFEFPGLVEMRQMSWIQKLHPQAGTWRLGVDCGRRCDFAFGFYTRDAVPTAAKSASEYKDAPAHFAESRDASSSRANDVRLPDGLKHLELAFGARADNDFGFELKDPSGRRQAALSLAGHSVVEDARYLVLRNPPGGDWRFEVGCRGGCAYGFGLYYD